MNLPNNFEITMRTREQERKGKGGEKGIVKMEISRDISNKYVVRKAKQTKHQNFSVNRKSGDEKLVEMIETDSNQII